VERAGRRRVLVVDDDADIRFLVRHNLEAHRLFEVVGEAASGEEAVTLAARLQPDAVVLDVAMPAVSGLDALPLIREVVGHKVAVVVLSALDARLTAADAELLGAVYMPKLEMSALPRRLAGLCQQGDR
jgi:DNA-binding NarL/FixJ family response regulator